MNWHRGWQEVVHHHNTYVLTANMHTVEAIELGQQGVSVAHQRLKVKVTDDDDEFS